MRFTDRIKHRDKSVKWVRTSFRPIALTAPFAREIQSEGMRSLDLRTKAAPDLTARSAAGQSDVSTNWISHFWLCNFLRCGTTGSTQEERKSVLVVARAMPTRASIAAYISW